MKWAFKDFAAPSPVMVDVWWSVTGTNCNHQIGGSEVGGWLPLEDDRSSGGSALIQPLYPHGKLHRWDPLDLNQEASTPLWQHNSFNLSRPRCFNQSDFCEYSRVAPRQRHHQAAIDTLKRRENHQVFFDDIWHVIEFRFLTFLYQLWDVSQEYQILRMGLEIPPESQTESQENSDLQVTWKEEDSSSKQGTSCMLFLLPAIDHTSLGTKMNVRLWRQWQNAVGLEPTGVCTRWLSHDFFFYVVFHKAEIGVPVSVISCHWSVKYAVCGQGLVHIVDSNFRLKV